MDLCVDCDAPAIRSRRCDDCAVEVEETPYWRPVALIEPAVLETIPPPLIVAVSLVCCVVCGRWCTSRWHGRLRKYCTKACVDRACADRKKLDGRRSAENEAQRRTTAERNARQNCALRECGAVFAAKVKRMYCSKSCAGKANRAQEAKRGRCAQPGCNRGIRARGLCSTHYNETKYGAGRSAHSAVCECCKKDYLAQRTGQRFCSLLCRNGGEFIAERTDAERRASRESRRRRRARIRETTVEKFTDLEIFERDRWRCGVCKRKVDRLLLWPHPMSPSLDHVIPQAPGKWGGGEHTRANVRLAHLRCNVSRGNRGGNEQLMLIG